jgi:hypothetical protein
MSDHFSDSDITSNPEGFIPLGELTIPTSFKELVLPGAALYPDAREKDLPENGLLFVGMNSAAYTKVPLERMAQVYTLGIAGCTAIAASAKIEKGTLAGVSHFDVIVDEDLREYGHCPSERFMNRFISVARKCGAETIKLSIKYAEMHQNDPRYGKFGGDYDDWFFLDQLESFTEEAEQDMDVTIEPYEDPIMSHTLSVNVDRNAQSHIAFL